MPNSFFHKIKYVSLTILTAITFTFFYAAPAPVQRILNIQNNFITVSGIISGIVIAYLAAKLFSIKQERERRQININRLSDKLTNYRRILYSVMHSREFWVHYSDISKFKKQYRGLDFERLHSQNGNDELSKKFSLEESELAHTTIDLYLAMEAIYGNDSEQTMTWVHQRLMKFNYTLDDLNRYYMPSNQIWYYLEGRYGKHTEGEINDTKIWNLYRDQVREWFSQIDNKFRNKDFDRHILADLSTDFHAVYIPKLIELTEINQEQLPKSVRNIFWNLVLIFVIGVIFPLFIQSLNLIDKWNILLTLSAVGLIIIGFFNFLFDFYKIMNEEIKAT